MASDQIESWLKEGFTPSVKEDWQMLDAAAQNVFRPTAPIDESSLFVGRIQQLQDLMDVVYQEGAHAIIYGERGVGKTSLANIINERILGPSKFNKVLKISCSPNDSFSTVWGNVFFDYLYNDQPVVDVVEKQPPPDYLPAAS